MTKLTATLLETFLMNFDYFFGSVLILNTSISSMK